MSDVETGDAGSYTLPFHGSWDVRQATQFHAVTEESLLHSS
jgi:hypothetical protein